MPSKRQKLFHPVLFPLMFLLLFASSPSAINAFNNAPVSLQEEMGCSPTLTFLFRGGSEDSKGVFFDPWSLATDDNFSRMREAELKHGRIAMVGVVSALVETSTQQDDFVSFLLAGNTPSVVQLLNGWSFENLIKFVVLCGVLETLVLVQISPQDLPGDYGVGYFGLRDKGKNEQSLVSELENGRLAMMVMLYYLVRDLWNEQQLFQELAKIFL